MQNRIVRAVAMSVFFLACDSLFAQGPGIPATFSTGQEPYGSYLNNPSESINLYNGNVLVSIPLISLPGRNSQNASLSVAYNSKQIVKVQTGPSSWLYSFQSLGPEYGLWRISNQPYVAYYSNQWTNANDPRCTAPNTTGVYATPQVYFYGDDQSQNEMHRTDTDATVFVTCISPFGTGPNVLDAGPYRSVNGTHLQFRGGSSVTNGKLFQRNGNRIDFSNSSAIKAIDTNGNYITYNINAGGQPTSLVDNLNRSINFTYDVNGNLYQATVLAANGQTQTYTFGYTTLHVNTYLSDCAAGVTGIHQDVTVLQSITLPNNLSYSFTYDQGVFENSTALGSCTAGGPAHNVYTSTLKLVKVTFPEGGYTRYAYNYVRPTASPDQIDKYVTTKYRNAQDGQGEMSWTLSYTADGSGNITATQITNPDSGTETHNFTGVLDTLIQYALGTAKMKDIAQTWTSEPGDDGTPQPSCANPGTRHNPRITRRTTSVYLNNTTYIQSKVESDYDQQGYLTTTCTPNIQHTNGNVTETREYAYGNAAPGSLVRRTDYTYLNSTAYNLNNAHILNRPSTQIVYDATGILQAQTNYGYDESALTNQTGATSHDDTNFGTTYTSRGNLTSVKDFLTTPAPGSWLTTTYTYDVLGNQRQKTDPKSNPTTYNYIDNFSDGINRNTFAYLGSTTNALNQVASTTYNFNTGLIASLIEPNGNTTSYTYNDIMNRKTAENYTSGGQMTYAYNDIIANPGLNQYPSTTTTTKIDNTKNRVETRYFDGVRRVRQIVLNDPQGNVFVDRTYDNTSCGCGGSNATKSNPYRSGDTVYTTTTLYDTLRRVVEVRPPDWNPANPTQNKTIYTYSVDMTNLVETTEIIDPAGKKKKHGYDALGMLVFAWEPDSGGSYTLSTSYQYNVLGKLTGVTQGGQTRTYNYDSLGRLTSEAHPEWNNLSTSYQYDNNGNLTSKTDPRNITTIMGYDALNRITSKTYTGDGGVTPSVTYTYDSAQVTNGTGSLTGLSSGLATSTFYYDSTGRLISEAKTIDGVAFTAVFRNPGFETTTTDGWTVTSGVQASVVSTQAKGGVCSLQITGATSGPVYQNIPGLTTGQSYGVSAWVRSDSGTTAQVQLIIDDTTGANSVSTAPITPGQVWQQISINYTANATQAMRIKLNYLTGSGTVYYDEVAISGVNFALSKNYNLIGNSLSLTYPSGMVIVNTFNAANRLTSITSNLSDANHIPSLNQITSYTARGAVQTATYGSGAGQLTRTNTYNSRNQPTRIQVGVPPSLGLIMDISYSYNEGTSNNRQVASMANNLDATKSVNYTYDELIRLSLAQQPQGNWSISWTYDRFGNRLSQTGTGGAPSVSLSTDATTNRINATGYGYDAVGNLIADPQHTYQYDAENRLIKIDNGATATYWYDGSGERVKKLVGGVITLYVLGVGDYSNGTWQKLYIQAAEARIEYNGNGTMYWYHQDETITARKVTDINGNVVSSKDYWPYGEEITATANNEKKYTGLYRDSESGFDYAVSRYYGASIGRFLSVDKFNIGALQLPGLKPKGFLRLRAPDLLKSPQSFNGFTYVTNNPTNRMDPYGYCGCALRCFACFDDPYYGDPDDCCCFGGDGGGGDPEQCILHVYSCSDTCLSQARNARCRNDGTARDACVRQGSVDQVYSCLRVAPCRVKASVRGKSCGGPGCGGAGELIFATSDPFCCSLNNYDDIVNPGPPCGR